MWSNIFLQEAKQIFSFDFGGGGEQATATKKPDVEEKAYQVPEDRAIGRPHMMGWLNLLGDEELTGGNDNDDDNKEETFEADKWEEVPV